MHSDLQTLHASLQETADNVRSSESEMSAIRSVSLTAAALTEKLTSLRRKTARLSNLLLNRADTASRLSTDNASDDILHTYNLSDHRGIWSLKAIERGGR